MLQYRGEVFMEDFRPNKINSTSELNNGKGQYVNEIDIPNADDWNKVINSQLYTQGLATNRPDVREIDGEGEPSVEIITADDGSAKLKLKNLKGKNGTSVSIISQSVTYQTSASDTTIPTGSWTTTIPTVPQGQYLWSKTIVSYSNDKSTTTYNVTYKPKDGTNGNDGATFTPSVNKNGDLSWSNDKGLVNPETVNIKGKDGESPTVKDVKIGWLASLSGTKIPTQPFLENPDSIKGTYEWSKTEVTFSDGKTAEIYSVAYQGEDGQDGTDGETITNITEGEAVVSETTTTTPITITTNKKTYTVNVVSRNGSSGGATITIQSYAYNSTITIPEDEVIIGRAAGSAITALKPLGASSATYGVAEFYAGYETNNRRFFCWLIKSDGTRSLFTSTTSSSIVVDGSAATIILEKIPVTTL